MDKVVKLPFYARLALSLLAVVLVLFFLMQGSTIFIPLVFALLISVLLLPLNKFLEYKLHLGRTMGAIVSVLLFIGCLVLFFYFMGIQIGNFAEDLPLLQQRFHEMLNNLQHWISREFHVNTRQQTDYLNKSAATIIGTVANSVGNIFLSVTELILWIVFIFIYTFFMLFHRRLLLRFIVALFPDEHNAKVYEVVTETRMMINSYVMGLLTEMILLSIVNCTVFSILGIKYAILLGVVAAVLNIIPYIGIYTAMVLSMLVTLANSDGNSALTLGLVMAIIHFIDANILMPRIVGSRVKMNPLITIIAVLVGNYIWGIPGMFLFIPLTGIMKIISERVVGMKPWAILIGVEDKPVKEKKKINPDK